MLRNDNIIFSFRGPFGVPIELGGSILFLFLIFLGFSFGDVDQLIWAMTSLTMLLGSIYLHELGHAWGAAIQGLHVRRIVIFGGGGFCEHHRSASAKEAELIVAMGPIVNFGLWAFASLVSTLIWASDDGSVAYSNLLGMTDYLDTFARINIALGLFNMVPVQPLDGGKLLHLALGRLMQPQMATRTAGLIGLISAVFWIPAIIVFYISTGWILFFIPSIAEHWRYFRAG